ncbi:MAG TPA: heme ABC transporter ATP-binding protein, partial [Acidimicrobiaceae bacterium]|nr:heme ABC transporter ATP-binding protein [Acidimicrobiaceae bacterium]
PEGRSSGIGEAVRLDVRGVTVKGAGERPLVDNVSFEIHEGEVLGIAGVEGNGQFELCQAIIGLEHHAGGTIVLNGIDVTRQSVQHRLENGVSYIPFDRHREGLLLTSPLWENTLLS